MAQFYLRYQAIHADAISETFMTSVITILCSLQAEPYDLDIHMQCVTDVKDAGIISQSCRLVMPLNAKTTKPCLPMPQGATAESSCRFPAFSRSYIHIWYPKMTCPVILVGSTFVSLFSTFCISACPPCLHASFGIFHETWCTPCQRGQL